MPELRKDPIIGRWVIISTERAKRPSDFENEKASRKKGFCPFCYGNEDKTPPEVLSYRKPDTKANTPGWWLRVVPNKFPALKIEGEIDRRGDGMYDLMNGVGAHEVIIETPDHEATLADHDDFQMQEILWAYRERMIELKKDSRFEFVMLFKNQGREAGASLDHPHTQAIAIPTIPKRVQEEMDGAKAYYNYRERCIFCDMIKQECSGGDRIVLENKRFVSFEPFASRMPFETWILPKAHQTHFEHLEKKEIGDLGQILKGTLRLLQRCLNNPPYNFLLHTTPCKMQPQPHYHWHIEVMPKLTKLAGFEWGTGFYINPTPPEEAAAFLRGMAQEEADVIKIHRSA